MAFKTDGSGSSTTNGGRKLEPYFKRLTPVAELEYDGAEVRIFDDREAMDEIKVQFFQMGENRRKCAVFTFKSIDALGELVQDLGQVLESLESVGVAD